VNLLLIIPALVFVIVVITIRVRPIPALLVFFGGPFVGTLILLVGGLLTLRVTGELGVMHLRDLLAYAFTFYIFDFPQALYPHGALLGAVVLLAYIWLKGFYNPSLLISGHRLAVGALIGALIGFLFAALVMVLVSITQQNTEFVRFITNGTLERLDLSTELLLSVCTGAVDGALIGILGVKGFRPEQLDGTVATATAR
jgi:hypothetical protein